MRFNFHALKLDDDDLFKIGQNTYLCHKIILDHAQFRSGQSTSAGDEMEKETKHYVESLNHNPN